MNILLAAILDKKVEKAVTKFSQLPFNDAVFNFNRYDQVMSLLEVLLNVYLNLFRALNLISQDDYLKYYQKKLILSYDGKLNRKIDLSLHSVKAIEEAVGPHFFSNRNAQINHIIPIYHHYSSISDLLLLAGVVIIKEKSPEMA